MNSVDVSHLSKSYSSKPAVKDLSFSVVPGEILGLIGPNGAGKSTTIKSILGFIKPEAGDIAVFGGALHEGVKNRLGYLPEEKGLYKKLTVIELIIYLASLKGVKRRAAEKKADELLEKMGMRAHKKKLKH